MNLFSIPEEVIYEISRSDIDYDCDDVPRLNRTCKLCDADGLMWIRNELETGWVLAYAHGPLAGKLHACESNRS